MAGSGKLVNEDAVREAYAHVADGYARALNVPRLPHEEAECLRRCLRAALELAQLPQLSLVPARREALEERSLPVG